MNGNGDRNRPAFNRRDVLGVLAGGMAAAYGGGAVVAQDATAGGGNAKPFGLKPGEFLWQPENAPPGPVVVIVSLPDQLVHVYRCGRQIGVSTCSTGTKGHRTPTGVFTILEKQRKHFSSIYNNAPMPNMERLTWGGIALHAGHLPGYPASHGCIRLPYKFSEKLFEVTHSGMPVIIADELTQPFDVVHPGLLMPDAAIVEARAVAGKVRTASNWDATVERQPAVSVVISRADGRAYVNRGGHIDGVYDVSFKDPKKPIGQHTYSLVGPADGDHALQWIAFGLGASSTTTVDWANSAVLQRIVFRDPQRAKAVAMSFEPGSTLFITDAAAGPRTRTVPKNFSVITTETT